MSIRERIREVLNKSLFNLPPADGSESVRTILASLEVHSSVNKPFSNDFYGHRLGLFRGTLDTFTKGLWVSIAQSPHTKKPSAYFAPVDPAQLDVWDIRSVSPNPQIRCFGCWAEKDTFVALTWRYRDDIERFSDEAKECRKEWDTIFPAHSPYKGSSIDGYITKRYWVV